MLLLSLFLALALLIPPLVVLVVVLALITLGARGLLRRCTRSVDRDRRPS
jgi:cytochrome c oxidase subunit IV